MVYKHAVFAAFRIYAQCGEVADKRRVGVCALNSHGNYIVDHRKSWKIHEIVFLNFCGNPDMVSSVGHHDCDIKLHCILL